MKCRLRDIVFACLVLVLAAPARAATQDAIEYYNRALDHYFVTALPAEIADLDAGAHVGWERTGYSFKVFDPATAVANASPVCRFLGRPEAGLDSHFYSASPAECADVLRLFANAWAEETDNAFGVYLPDTQSGQCPANSIPVYRSWNNRADSNHRFTTDANVQRTMLAKGYKAEGYGPGPLYVAMCSPTDGGGTAAPACSLSASNLTPSVGTIIALTATCTNAPTSFAWSGCSSTSSTCSAGSASTGPVVYSVVASNAAGAGAPASVTVTWGPGGGGGGGSVAKCTLSRTSQTDPPKVNDSVVLKVTCNAAVGSYTWNGCSSTSAVCVARESTPGAHTYSVFARNSAGASEPATLTLGWAASAPPPPGLCGGFPSYLWSDLGMQGGRVESAALVTPPGFAWNGAWAVRFVVPSTIGTRVGRLSAAEFAGEPTVREATISRTPCDFRATDPSGVNGPLGRSSGISVTNWFTAQPTPAGYPVLTPGATYYYNVRNYQPATGTITCASGTRCDAFVEALLPK